MIVQLNIAEAGGNDRYTGKCVCAVDLIKTTDKGVKRRFIDHFEVASPPRLTGRSELRVSGRTAPMEREESQCLAQGRSRENAECLGGIGASKVAPFPLVLHPCCL